MEKMYVKTIRIMILLLAYFSKISSQDEWKKLDLFDGEICMKVNGLNENHICTPAEKCESLQRDIKNKIYPDICSFNGSKPIVCCSPTNSNNQQQDRFLLKYMNANIIKKKCDEYAYIANKLEHPLYRVRGIVNGIKAAAKEFPHMALLGFGDTIEEPIWGCGGSLINERWILTAAHCKELGPKNPARWARLGDLNIAIDTDNAQPKDYRIVQHVVHPDYKPSSRYNDIALFRLETDVEFTIYARPICLNTDPSLNPEVLIATGWGKTATGEATSDHLLKVKLSTVPPDQCNSSYYSSISSKLKFGILSESMMCAGSYVGEEDTCGGDSGGPLQIVYEEYEYDRIYNQIGITSFSGVFCGDKNVPGVYTRVANYIPWIQSIVWP